MAFRGLFPFLHYDSDRDRDRSCSRVGDRRISSSREPGVSDFELNVDLNVDLDLDNCIRRRGARRVSVAHSFAIDNPSYFYQYKY